jgi:glycosyltransferase involved in cell wall biosynthesis
VLNVASLHDKKGHDHLLQALAIVLRDRAGVELEIVGDGPRRPELELLAESLDLGRHVRFLGLRNRYEIAELMRRVDVFVLPSLWENAPHVIIEALASGLPVVATDVGGVSELLDGTGFGLVAPGDPDALAQALVQACRQRGDHDPAALAEHARERFGQEAVGRRWTDLYSRVLSER